MRFVLIIVAALMILGLAAFGVVSAQKMAAVPASPGAPDTRVAASAPAAPRAPVSEPVSQIAQAGASSSAPRRRIGSRWPTRMAQYADGTDHAGSGGCRAERTGGNRSAQKQARRGGEQYFAMRQTRRHGPGAGRRDRHDRRPGLRLRALQAVRLPPRKESF